MIPASTLPLPRNRHLDLLLQDRLELRDEADVRKPFLHDDGNRLGPFLPALVNRILEHLDRDAIPTNAFAFRADFLLQREVPVELQVQGMILPDACVLRFIHNLPVDMQLGALRIEIDVLDPDLQHEVYPRDRCCTAGLRRGDFADCAGFEDIIWSDEVVCMPLGAVVSQLLHLLDTRYSKPRSYHVFGLLGR